jgi:hypothetical protein
MRMYSIPTEMNISEHKFVMCAACTRISLYYSNSLIIIFSDIYPSMALQPFGPWPHFQFLNPTHRR